MDEQDKYQFLNDEPPAEAEPEQPEAEAEPERVEEPQPEAAKPEAPTAPEHQEDRVPIAALKAERAKRQQYERELAELRKAQEEQRPKPDFYSAPEEYVQTLLSQHEQQLTQRMLGALEAQAREVYPDYDELIELVQEKAQENPVLVQQVMNSPNPAMAVVKLGKQLKELDRMKDPDAYRKQIEAEVRAKVDAEYRAKEEARLKAASAIPPDLTAARASRGDEPLPDDSLESILASRKR